MSNQFQVLIGRVRELQLLYIILPELFERADYETSLKVNAHDLLEWMPS